MTYLDKRIETEIIELLDKKKLQIFSEDLIVVPEDVFRKIKHGREQTPPHLQNIRRDYGRNRLTEHHTT